MDQTAVIPAVPEPPPVFVDPSGRRRRWLRRLAYGFGVLGVGYTLLVGVSFAGGPARPETIVPFVEATASPTWQPPPTLSPDRARPSARPTSLPTGTPTAGTGATALSSASTRPSAPRPSDPATLTSPTASPKPKPERPERPEPKPPGPTGQRPAGE